MDEHLRTLVLHSRRALKNPYAYIEYLEDMAEGYRSGQDLIASGDPIKVGREGPQDFIVHADGDAMAGCGTGIQLISKALAPKRDARHHRLGQIEAQATDLLRRMWRERDRLWEGHPPSDATAVIDPAVALRLIGYDFSPEEDLGAYRSDKKTMKVAGIIDHASKTVHVSKRFPKKTRMFTAAHELGHAVLQHNAGGSIHRDRPLDGKAIRRDGDEFEADKFASYFLMPAKLVRKHFMALFGTEYFSLTEDSAFSLCGSSLYEVQQACGSLRELSRMLAKAGSYQGRYFSSLADQFHVSVEAMAIRLEELGLIEPWLLEEA